MLAVRFDHTEGVVFVAVEFGELMELRKGGLSYRDLEDLTGGVVKAFTWNTWALNSPRKPREFPAVRTIRAMAAALGLSETETLLAMAVTIGLDVGAEGGSEDLVVRGAGVLPDVAKRTIVDVASVMLRQYQQEHPPGPSVAPVLVDAAPEPV